MEVKSRHPEGRKFIHTGYRFVGYHPNNGCRKVSNNRSAPSTRFTVGLTDESEAWEEAKKKASMIKCYICDVAYNSNLTQAGRVGDWV